MYRHYKRHKKYYSKGMTEQDIFQWVLTTVVFILVFIGIFAYRFATNCVFHLPIRWDVRTCWNEQKTPAKEKAIEKASMFAPL